MKKYLYCFMSTVLVSFCLVQAVAYNKNHTEGSLKYTKQDQHASRYGNEKGNYYYLYFYNYTEHRMTMVVTDSYCVYNINNGDKFVVPAYSGNEPGKKSIMWIARYTGFFGHCVALSPSNLSFWVTFTSANGISPKAETLSYTASPGGIHSLESTTKPNPNFATQYLVFTNQTSNLNGQYTITSLSGER